MNMRFGAKAQPERNRQGALGVGGGVGGGRGGGRAGGGVHVQAGVWLLAAEPQARSAPRACTQAAQPRREGGRVGLSPPSLCSPGRWVFLGHFKA